MKSLARDWMISPMVNTLVYFLGFLVLALSARQIGSLFSRIRLPQITGYLFAGILIGPYALKLLSSEAIGELRFIDELALAVIAFTAGSEFYLAEMRSRMRSITGVTIGLVAATFVFGATALVFLADYIPIMRDMPLAGRIAVSILGATILVTRSPSSAVAIISELRAKGPFTKTVLGVTVVMDVVVIVLFGLCASLASAHFTERGFDLGFILLILSELALSLGIGLALGHIIPWILKSKVRRWIKIFFVLGLGYLVFVGSDELRHFSAARFPFELLLEPLLICMIASFRVANYSTARLEFDDILHDVGPPVFVAFFTLTGASIELDVLARVWPITMVLVLVRLTGIATGSFIGGALAGDPLRFNRVAWMGYITQAGIGLGLAKEVADEFPALGADFATIFISVIVVNQFLGPPFFKFVIKHLGESHLRGEANPDEVRYALILGIEGQSITLARQLQNQGWQVLLADTDDKAATQRSPEGVDRHHLPEITKESLGTLITSSTDALVAMLHDDEANLRACELAYGEFGIPRLIVRVNDPAWTGKFRELGALVVDPASAMVNLLDRFVRAPWAALLLQRDQQYDTVEVTITDPDLAGLSLRELRFPEDVLVLSIYRRKHWVIPHGYTVLRRNDNITLMGSFESLREITRRFGY